MYYIVIHYYTAFLSIRYTKRLLKTEKKTKKKISVFIVPPAPRMNVRTAQIQPPNFEYRCATSTTGRTSHHLSQWKHTADDCGRNFNSVCPYSFTPWCFRKIIRLIYYYNFFPITCDDTFLDRSATPVRRIAKCQNVHNSRIGHDRIIIIYIIIITVDVNVTRMPRS
jgi:hypothetical protein